MNTAPVRLPVVQEAVGLVGEQYQPEDWGHCAGCHRCAIEDPPPCLPGCISCEFDAKGTDAETVAADADDALGSYPVFELRRRLARDAGFDID